VQQGSFYVLAFSAPGNKGKRMDRMNGQAAGDPWRVVERMLAGWHALDAAAVIDWFAEDAVMHNMMMDPLEGKAAIRGLLDMFFARAEKVEMEIVSRAVAGDTVMIERRDHFVWNGRTGTLPVVGVFEVRDGLIRSWREYFDRPTYERQAYG